MRARIIFRGLTLFRFDPPEGTEAAGQPRTLTALLVSDPGHAGMPLHTHTPYLGLIGRDRGVANGPGRIETKRRIPAELRIELLGHGIDPGVQIAESFLNYVPRLGDLHWSQPAGYQDGFITTRITIPHGTIRARDFITWDAHGNTPTRVAYMDTNLQGFGANEVVVDIGDDSDTDHHDDNKFLAITGQGINERLWPKAKGAAFDEDIDPNVVELVITNLPARRRRAVFWGIHFETLFDAAGYPRRSVYQNAVQYNNFATAAAEYDAYEWQSDLTAMGIGQPFPYLINPGQDKLDPIQGIPAATRTVAPDPPPGRRSGEGIPAGNPGGHGGMHSGHDPQNTQICPFGRE